MASTQVDRISNPTVNGSLGIKAPVRVATTADINASLTGGNLGSGGGGLPTIDGVALNANDRVLVKNQTDQTTNGIWVATATAWQRDVDANSNTSWLKGTIVLVTDGTASAGLFYELTTANPVTIGSSSLAFAVTSNPTVSGAMSPVVGAATLAAARTAFGATATGAAVFTAADAPTARTTLGLGNVAVEAIGQGLQDDGAGNLRVKLDTAAGSTGLLRSANGLRIDPSVLRGFIDGFETGAPGAANVLTIGPGACVDDANADAMGVTTTFTKSLASWAVGSGNGALDQGASGGAASTPYFVWVIMRPDTGVVDYLFSLSGTAPLQPASYTVKRLIGWFKTDASKNILQFQQRGDEFIYGVSPNDVNVGTLTTARSLFTLTVPSGFQVDARVRVLVSNAGAVNVILTSPDETDQAPGSTGAGVDLSAAAAVNVAGRFSVRTNTSAQIGARSDTASTTIRASTFGFVWSRGRNS